MPPERTGIGQHPDEHSHDIEPVRTLRRRPTSIEKITDGNHRQIERTINKAPLTTTDDMLEKRQNKSVQAQRTSV